MLEKISPTFLVVSRRDGESWRLFYCFLTLVGLIAVIVGIFQFGQMQLRVADYDRLLAENDAFRAENHNYRIQTAQLGEKIDFLEATSRQLMVLSDASSNNALGGVGGFSKESLKRPPSASAGSLQSIDLYNRKVIELENRYRGLSQTFSETALVAAAMPLFLPVKGYVTGGVGRRSDPFNPSMHDYHTGIDISAPYGSRVVAPADGTVLFAGRKPGYGNIVVIDHRFGIVTRYGHLWKFSVQTGQFVSRNDVIGYVGSSGRSTGPHLHYELWVHNRVVNPQRFFRLSNRVG
jgi:murein DD-endopeptidase MepM/ murein hydrolase activator NlpD